MPLVLYQAKVLDILMKLNIWNSFEQEILKLKMLVFSSKTKQPDAPKKLQFEWKLKTKCTQIIKNKMWLTLNLGHTFYSMFFWYCASSKSVLKWCKNLQRSVTKNLSSVCCWKARSWKGTLCFLEGSFLQTVAPPWVWRHPTSRGFPVCFRSWAVWHGERLAGAWGTAQYNTTSL